MKISLIMAMSADGFVTKHQDGLVDWTSKEDKKHFVALTKQAGVVIYGRKTYEFHKKPLPGRLNIILTRQPDISLNQPDLLEFTNQEPQQIVENLESRGYKEAVVAGGPEINALFLKAGLIDELYLTIEPKLFGSGKPLIADPSLDASLELIDSSPLNANSLLLHYRIKH
jgi:dihydrofolate reductase